MKLHLQNSLRTGIVFGIAIIFLILVGFHVTAVDLLKSLLRNGSSEGIFGLPPSIFNLVIFMALIGLWAGARGAQRTERDSWMHALLGGATAGATCGLLVAGFAYILGSLNDAGVKMSTYLAQVLPAAVKLFLMDRNPLMGSLSHFVILLISGAAGGLLARGLGRGAWRKGFSERWSNGRTGLSQQPFVQGVRRSQWTRYAFYGLLLLVIFLLPLRLGQYWNYTVGTIGIYVLLGLGLNIVVGLAGLLDLGYVAFFAIGAYTVGLLTAPQPHNLMWSFWIALLIGIVLAALAGILLGIPVLRLRGDYLAIVTLGFGEIIRILSKSDLLSGFSGGPRGVRDIGSPTLFGRPFNNDIAFVYLIFLAVVLIIFFTNRLQHSRVGRAWIAMREDETVAQAMGINTLQHKLLAFSIGAAFAGLGGVLFASRNQFTGPEDHNLMVSINVLSLVIVGGMGSIPGVIAGAFVLKGLPEVLRQLENYRVLAFGALLVVMMIIRPEGLIPSTRRRLEMHTTSEEEPPEPVHPVSTDLPEKAGVTATSDVTISTDISPDTSET